MKNAKDIGLSVGDSLRRVFLGLADACGCKSLQINSQAREKNIFDHSTFAAAVQLLLSST